MPELVCAADSPDWLTERRRGVTATDITAITGLSPYESAYSLYFKKRGDIPDDHTDNDRLRLGRELEPIILGRWGEAHPDVDYLHGFRFTETPPSWGPQLYRSSSRPWQLATPDAVLFDAQDQPNAVLEVKSWADIDRDRWADGPPARVRAQVLWQMDTLDVATGHVGVLFLPSGEFRSYIIRCENSMPHPRTDDHCHTCADIDLLRSAGRDFMDRLDLNDPPSPDASSATLAALKARFTDIHHDKQAEIAAELWGEFSNCKDSAAEFADMAREAENRIREQAGEARTLTVNGTPVATRVVSVQNVKAHQRHMDYIRRVPSKGDTDV